MQKLINLILKTPKIMENTTMNAQEKFIANFIKQQDNVMVSNSVIDMKSMLGIPTRVGLENGIISNGALVNVVSNQYGHLPNQAFFGEVERQDARTFTSSTI